MSLFLPDISSPGLQAPPVSAHLEEVDILVEFLQMILLLLDLPRESSLLILHAIIGAVNFNVPDIRHDMRSSRRSGTTRLLSHGGRFWLGSGLENRIIVDVNAGEVEVINLVTVHGQEGAQFPDALARSLAEADIVKDHGVVVVIGSELLPDDLDVSLDDIGLVADLRHRAVIERLDAELDRECLALEVFGAAHAGPVLEDEGRQDGHARVGLVREGLQEREAHDDRKEEVLLEPVWFSKLGR